MGLAPPAQAPLSVLKLTVSHACGCVCTASVCLQAAACYHSCSHDHIQHIQSTTIPPNTPTLRVFRKLGFTHSRTVDRWPQEHLQLGYEAAVGFVPNMQQPEQPVQFAPQQLHMLDHIPGEGCACCCQCRRNPCVLSAVRRSVVVAVVCTAPGVAS